MNRYAVLIGFAFSCFSCLAWPANNFVLVSTQSGPSHFEQNLHKNDANFVRIFSFYPNSSDVRPKILTKKDNMLFLCTDENKFEPLGFFLPPESKDLSHMENSVVEGKLLLGFKNKAHESVALIQDSSGMIYSVTRLSKQRYSIQSLGVLASNNI